MEIINYEILYCSECIGGMKHDEEWCCMYCWEKNWVILKDALNLQNTKK